MNINIDLVQYIQISSHYVAHLKLIYILEKQNKQAPLGPEGSGSRQHVSRVSFVTGATFFCGAFPTSVISVTSRFQGELHLKKLASDTAKVGNVTGAEYCSSANLRAHLG